MKIEISDEGVIFCSGIPCNPIELWENSAACGDCPMIQWGEEFCNAYFDDAIFTTKIQGRKV